MYFGVAFVYPFDSGVKTVTVVGRYFLMTVRVGEIFSVIPWVLFFASLGIAGNVKSLVPGLGPRVARLPYPEIGYKVAVIGHIVFGCRNNASTVVEHSQAIDLPSVRVSQNASPTLPVDVHISGLASVSVWLVLLVPGAVGTPGVLSFVVLLPSVAVPRLVHPWRLRCL